MLTISKPLSASQARTYHKDEFACRQQNYWSRDQRVFSEWQGRLAEKWGLAGPVQDEHFARLAEGQHPRTGAARPAPDFADLRGQERQRSHQRRAPCRDHVFERSAVHDRRAILESALARGMGETTYASIRQEFERRVKIGEFCEVGRNGAGRQLTTMAMMHMEREIIVRMQDGNRRGYGDPMLVSPQVRIWTEDRHPELSASQRQAVDNILVSREKIVGLDGIAGAGKTTALSVIRESAEADGYRVEGFAPTSRAAQKLSEAGMETSTLQRYLARSDQADTCEKRLYVLDESSMASTRQLHEFIHRLHPNDRVLLVGDRRQHEAVEAGRPFAQLQDAGMVTVKLDEVVRQKDPDLKRVVEQLARGEVREAVQNLEHFRKCRRLHCRA